MAGGIQPETRRTLENIRATLERYGSSMDRVVKCTVMSPPGARSGADGLALGAALEIECRATVGG